MCLAIIATPCFSGRYSTKLCSNPDYHCVRAKKGDSWGKLFPDFNQRMIVMKINRMTIPLTPGLIIAIPNNLKRLDYMDVSPFPRQTAPSGKRSVVISIQNQAFGAYDEFGSLTHWGPVSSAQGYCKDVGKCTTPRGRFQVYRKGGDDCKSGKFPLETNGGAPMQHCMFFNAGYAMHAGQLPGYPASHGCVRMPAEDAEWLNHDFVELGKNPTKVIVEAMLDKYISVATGESTLRRYADLDTPIITFF